MNPLRFVTCPSVARLMAAFLVAAAGGSAGPGPAAAAAMDKASKPAEARAGALRAGAAVADITPRQFPMDMVGGFSPDPARGAHDPLQARAVFAIPRNPTLLWVGARSTRVPIFPDRNLARGWNASLPGSGVQSAKFQLGEIFS